MRDHMLGNYINLMRYRIMLVLKFETDIITSINMAVSPMGQAVILVLLFVETLKRTLLFSLVT